MYLGTYSTVHGEVSPHREPHFISTELSWLPQASHAQSRPTLPRALLVLRGAQRPPGPIWHMCFRMPRVCTSPLGWHTATPTARHGAARPRPWGVAVSWTVAPTCARCLFANQGASSASPLLCMNIVDCDRYTPRRSSIPPALNYDLLSTQDAK
jgi:hypothetical protein